MLSRILALVLKEFLALLKDKRSRVVLIAPPLIQMMIFGYAATFDLKNVPFAVYNEDRGRESRELLAAFDGSPAFTRVTQIAREGEIAPLIDGRHVLMVVHARPDFSANLINGRPAPLQVIVDGRNSNTAMLAINEAMAAASRQRTSRPARGSTPTWRAAGSSCPVSSVSSRCW